MNEGKSRGTFRQETVETMQEWLARNTDGSAQSQVRTLLRVNALKRRPCEPWEEHLAYRCFQQPRPISFDGTSGFTTKQITEAMIKSICPAWHRIFVTVQFQGMPARERAMKVLREAAVLRDKGLIGKHFNRQKFALHRTIDFFFEEQGAGVNSGTRHFHGLVLISPTHPRLEMIETAISESVIEAMAWGLSRGTRTGPQHRDDLQRKQSHASGKVVMAERCLNRACALGYSMKQFDVMKGEYFTSINDIDSKQIRRMPPIKDQDFRAALPGAPTYATPYSVFEYARHSPPPCST